MSKLDPRPSILILNGSPSGSRGNCARLVRYIGNKLKGRAGAEVAHLAHVKKHKQLRAQIASSSACIFVTGTYWDSWGSPLQICLEQMTKLEGTSQIMGKPCATFVLMHSVGGKSVLSRLQGVLSTFGFLIPPMSGMVLSLNSTLASKSYSSDHSKDFWCLEDADVVLENLMTAVIGDQAWKAWPVDRKDPKRVWLKKM